MSESMNLEVVYCGDVPLGVGERLNSESETKTYRMICNPVFGESPSDEDTQRLERYMQLFAASKKLLTACEETLKTLRAWHKNDGVWAELQDRLTAAIASATPANVQGTTAE